MSGAAAAAMIAATGVVLHTTASLISGGTGTAIGNIGSEGGALTKLFDGSKSRTTAETGEICFKSTVTSIYAGKDYSASPKRIFSARTWGTSDQGYCYGIAPTVTLNLRGKNGSAPSGATDGTLLGTTSFTDASNESSSRTVTSTDTETLWDYVFIEFTQNGSAATMLCVEQEYDEAI